MTYLRCCICGLPTDAFGGDALVWHTHCYTPEMFERRVLPLVNNYIDGLRIQLAPVMREALITELVRRQMETRGTAVFHDLAALKTVVSEQFKVVTENNNA